MYSKWGNRRRRWLIDYIEYWLPRRFSSIGKILYNKILTSSVWHQRKQWKCHFPHWRRWSEDASSFWLYLIHARQNVPIKWSNQILPTFSSGLWPDYFWLFPSVMNVAKPSHLQYFSPWFVKLTGPTHLE